MRRKPGRHAYWAGRTRDKDRSGSETGDMSTMTGGSGADGTRRNSRGESHCYNCGAKDHWAYECPELSSKQQAQLHMNVGGNGDEEQEQEERQLLNSLATTFF